MLNFTHPVTRGLKDRFICIILILALLLSMVSVFSFSIMPITAKATNNNNVLVGAIRWDAWTGDSTTGYQTERSLGPNKYHFRIPYYGMENSYDSAKTRELNQTIMDEEIAYAYNANIDYWAFCWYGYDPTNNALATARSLYLNSEHCTDIKFCYIFSYGYFDATSVSYMVDDFGDSNYVTVNGSHPLVYLFGNNSWTSTYLDNLRTAAVNAGFTGSTSLYIAYMGDDSASNTATKCTSLGCQAITKYNTGGQDGEAFTTQTGREKDMWDDYKDAAISAGIKMTPWVTTGSDARPRIDNPVTWWNCPSNYYAQTATPSEIATHLQEGIDFVGNNSTLCNANAALMYAWDEFDEGGWLCPTLTPGKIGSIDTSRLNAVAGVLGGTSQSSVDPLVSNWKFENNGNDSQGSNTATAQNGATYTSGAGINNNYTATLDGTNDYFTVSDNSSLKGMSEITCSVWIKLNSIPAGNCQILDKNGSYRINLNSYGGVHFVVATTNNSWYSTGTTATSATGMITTGKWYHIVGVYDGKHVFLYINGVRVGSGAQDISGNITSNIYGLNLGKSVDANYLNGSLDEVEIYNTGLNADQVTSLYNSYIDDPISVWSLNAQSKDLVSGNDATANGGLTYTDSFNAIRYQGALLDGSNDNFSVADDSSLKGMSKLTCSVWIKLNSLPAGNCQILDKNGTYRINVNSAGGVHFVVATTNNSWYSTGTSVSASTTLTTGTWYNIIGVYDGSHVKIYINGSLDGTGASAISGNIASNTNALYFGKDVDANYMNGILDEVQVYNTALNAGQISALYASYVPANAMISQWSFENNGNDSVASNNLTSYGGVSYATGKKNYAASFDGTDDYFTGSNDSSLLDLKQITCSIWVKFNSLPSTGETYMIFEKSSSFRISVGDTHGFSFVVNTSNNSWYSTGTKAQTDPDYISTDTWYHVVGVYDGSYVKLYINGSLVATGDQAISGPIVSKGSGLNIGDYAGHYLDGYLDEAQIYNYGLNATQVSNLYNSY